MPQIKLSEYLSLVKKSRELKNLRNYLIKYNKDLLEEFDKINNEIDNKNT